MLNSVCVSECGPSRSINQDRAESFNLNQVGLYFVADGMGGHYAGEKASELIRSSFSDWWQSYLSAPQRPRILQAIDQMKDVVSDCNQKILQLTPAGQRCGSTFVLLWIDGTDYAVLSVGDSRCYMAEKHFFSTSIVQLTVDDVVTGTTPWEIQNQGKLRHAVGATKDCPISLRTGHIVGNTLFLLCSDGVYKYCEEKIINELMRKGCTEKDLTQIGTKLKQAILSGPAGDNYSFVLVGVNNK